MNRTTSQRLPLDFAMKRADEVVLNDVVVYQDVVTHDLRLMSVTALVVEGEDITISGYDYDDGRLVEYSTSPGNIQYTGTRRVR